MRWLCLLASFGLAAAGVVNPGLAAIKTVYILPMGSSMDQYLANRLSQMGSIRVVADPQAADAVVTDRIGELFEKKLNELYPAPKDEDDEDDADSAKNAEQARPQSASFGQGKGTYFIVDRKTRNVVWSIYARPRNSSADELNRTAEKIAHRLKHDLAPPAATN
jgi:hypothetical protein